MKMFRVLVVAFLIHFSTSAQVVHRYYYDKGGAVTDSASSYWYTELEARATNPTFSYYTLTKNVRSKEIKDSLGTKRFYYHPAKGVKAEIVLDKNGWTKSIRMYYS